MKKIIVTTTIYPKTEAIERFDDMSDWELIVVGDLKTPKNYHLNKGLYVSPEDQVKIDPKLSDAIGWNMIQRRNFGLLLAYQHGADIVAVVDDDNVPYDNWGENLVLGQEIETNFYETDQLCFDPVGATNYPNLWHRGFPLQLLSQRDYSKVSRKKIVPDVQADFWNGDPDIDAICRMEHAPNCDFDRSCFPIASNKPSPFNSQNTFLLRHVIPDYFIFPHVGRMDDIWPSYYVQSRGHTVVYCEPTVVQKRNEHDLTVDFNKEIIGYQNNVPLIRDTSQDPESIRQHLPGKTIWAWDLYREHIKRLS
jgi:hypothetical protein